MLEGFQQADPTARKRFRGIGLGLRLLTRMVAAMGGKVDVTSTLGAGTEFVVTVPPRAETSVSTSDVAPMAQQLSA